MGKALLDNNLMMAAINNILKEESLFVAESMPTMALDIIKSIAILLNQ
jgi:hypothetical protein